MKHRFIAIAVSVVLLTVLTLATNRMNSAIAQEQPEKPFRKTVVLTFDDATKSQVELALPLLLKYKFHATFFICRFDDAWRARNERYLMTQQDVKLLCDSGMEVGNHTWSHAWFPDLTQEEIAEEIDKLDAWVKAAGCPAPVSHAYPGGPYHEGAAKILREKGYQCARALERSPGAWTRQTDPMHIPSVSMSQGNDALFHYALELCKEGAPVVILYHGVPDIVHPNANTDFADFERQMKYLYDNGYEVIPMKEAFARMEAQKTR